MAGVFEGAGLRRTGPLDRAVPVNPETPEEQAALNATAPEQSEFTKGLRRAMRNMSASSRGFVGGVAEPFAPEFAERQFAAAEQIARSQPADLAP